MPLWYCAATIIYIQTIAPTQTVHNVTTEALSPTSLRVRWYPPNQDEWNGIITRYTIEYSLIRPVEEDDDDDNEGGLLPDYFMTFITYAPSSRQRLRNSPDPTVANTPLAQEELEIDGLQEYFVYSVSIYYENPAGRSVSSDSVFINMPPAGS